MKIDSIIFDLDGTLWDSSENVVNSFNEVLEKCDDIKKLITVEDMKSVMGMLLDDIAKKFWPYLTDERRDEVQKACTSNEVKYLEKHGGILFEGLEETLKILSEKYKLFIVSNCQVGYIEAFYKSHGLEKYFTDYENPGRTGLSKGENIKLVIERNNLKKPVYVGDTNGDYLATKVAGIPFIHAKYGFGKIEDQVIEINDIRELQHVEKL
ncbi:HAD family hydrolase [Clostridium sp. MSJ-8]|uniref:HAD family hydrolase n=1 Tax=Clostridium sp. MSJ-8 TaxID=2841510 RepID=UPI001C0EE2F1|nr:HAD family hydrolase [Clostridium sp. MSJ-8]MBU5487436.1 HAD family hydrolase [Clostridium sp. MSJ-8]